MCKNLPVFSPCAWFSPVVFVKPQCTDRYCLSSTGLLTFPVWQPWPTQCPAGKRSTVGSLHKTSLKPWSKGRDSARNINLNLSAQRLACRTHSPRAGLRAVTPVLQAHPATQGPGILRAVNPQNSSVGFSAHYCTRAPLLCSHFWFVDRTADKDSTLREKETKIPTQKRVWLASNVNRKIVSYLKIDIFWGFQLSVPHIRLQVYGPVQAESFHSISLLGFLIQLDVKVWLVWMAFHSPLLITLNQ